MTSAKGNMLKCHQKPAAGQVEAGSLWADLASIPSSVAQTGHLTPLAAASLFMMLALVCYFMLDLSGL